MEEIYKVLGWQGGTVHQIVNEIKIIKSLNSELLEVLKSLANKLEEQMNFLGLSDELENSEYSRLKDARQVIAKAEGKTQ